MRLMHCGTRGAKRSLLFGGLSSLAILVGWVYLNPALGVQRDSELAREDSIEHLFGRDPDTAESDSASSVQVDVGGRTIIIPTPNGFGSCPIGS
jgi:hypothetical protein